MKINTFINPIVVLFFIIMLISNYLSPVIGLILLICALILIILSLNKNELS